MLVLKSERAAAWEMMLWCLLAKHFFSLHICISLFHTLCCGLYLLILWQSDIFWTVFGYLWLWAILVDLGLSFEIGTLWFSLDFVLAHAVLLWTMQIFDKLEFLHFSILCISSLASKYPSLFVNREKSRDLQRGLTDSSQLPLMMNPNFNCLLFKYLSALTFLSFLCK